VADAVGATVARGDAQRLPSPFRVFGVDRDTGVQELIDYGQPLVIGGHDQRQHSLVERRRFGEPAGQVAGCGGLGEASDLRAAARRTSSTSVIPNTAACRSAVALGTPPASSEDHASMDAPAAIKTRATSASP